MMTRALLVTLFSSICWHHSSAATLHLRRSLQDDSSADSKDAMEQTRDTIIIIGVGSVSVFVLLAAVYMIALLVDKCSSDGADGGSGSTANGGGFDEGILHRKANLWGLTVKERIEILPILFLNTMFIWNEDTHGDRTMGSGGTSENRAVENADPLETRDEARADTANETAVNQSAEAAEEQATASKVISDSTPAPSDERNTEADAIEPASTTPAVNHDDEEDELDNNTLLCSICLAPFVNGTQVMTGTRCAHVYHQTCCMSWLQNNDHCPYCRKEMMTPLEFRQAALIKLGERRLEKMRLPYQARDQEVELTTVQPARVRIDGTEEDEEVGEPERTEIQ